MIRVLLVSLAVMGSGLWAGRASAHATPVAYQPEATSVVAAMPSNVTIDFSERIEPAASSIMLFTPQGESTRLQVTVSPGEPRRLTAPISSTGTGTYTVSWQVVSADDGHFTNGAYGFSVGTVSDTTPLGGNARFQIRHETRYDEGSAIVVELFGQSLLVGILACLLWLMRPTPEDVRMRVAKHGRRLAFLSIGMIVVGTAFTITIGANDLRAANAFSFASAVGTYSSTSAGGAALVRGILAILLLIPFFFIGSRQKRIRTVSWTGIAVGILVMLYVRAYISHAAASSFHPLLSVFINFVHVAGKDVWIGSVAVFVGIVLPALALSKDSRLTATLLTRLSMLISVALAIGGVTGSYIVWLHLKSLHNLLATHWGMQCAVLTVFAFALLGIRMYHIFYTDAEAVAMANGVVTKPSERWISLPFTLLTESILGAAVLTISGFLIITTPPVSPPSYDVLTSASLPGTVLLTRHPLEESSLMVSLQDAKHQLIDTTSLAVSLTNTNANVGPIAVAAVERAPGEYVFPVASLSPAGVWTVNVTGQRSGEYDVVGHFTVDTASLFPAHFTHTDGGLLPVSIASALVLFFLALYLYCKSKKLNTKIDHKNQSAFGSLILLPPGPCILAVAVQVILFTYVAYMLHHHSMMTPFQRQCEQNGHLWHESVPMRDGLATSALALPGCMTGMGAGAFHFPYQNEYAYFTRPSDAAISMITDTPEPVAGKPVAWQFSVRDSAGKPVTDLSRDHDRILHIIVISQDFGVFNHVHVEDQTSVTADMKQRATFPLAYTFPRAGEYMVAVDATVRSQLIRKLFYVSVSGSTHVVTQAQPDFSRTKELHGYTIALTAPAHIRAGKPVDMAYHMERDGKPVTSLQPYLSAAMHLAVLDTTLRQFQHTHGYLLPNFPDNLLATPAEKLHGYLPDSFGPDIHVTVAFPVAGTYAVFAEFNDKGVIHPVKFLLKVE
ncbi:MAG: putative secreted protein [Candidatus Peribacteria bacterium]|nr:putative secreted protein [Candidatus Peribacteria bacterium]